MPAIRQLAPTFAVAPQITAADMNAIRAAGYGFIVNNRPDAEEPGQPEGAAIEEAALAAGLGYLAIPIDRSGYTADHVAALSALMVSPRPILAFCRSGTRSATLWALASASRGAAPADILGATADAGYDLGGLAPTLHQLSGAG